MHQTIVSLVVLTTLALVGLGIIVSQYRPNPAVEAIKQLASSDFEGTQPAATAFEVPEQLTPLSPPENFDRNSLSDKIDGKAELYLSAGFAELTAQRFRSAANEALWLEAFVYNMQSFENAYAVYSLQRRQDAEPMGLTREAYRTPNALFLVHGPFYIEIIGTEASEPLFDAMLALAGAFVRTHPVEASNIAEEDLFPSANRATGDLVMIAADAFGYAGFDRVFTATYRIVGAELTAFVSQRASEEAARKLVSDYGAFLLDFGGEAVEIDAPAMQGAQVVNILDTIEIIFSSGPYVAGVREAQDLETALDLAAELAARIKEKAGEP
jgi:hypothetical protein